MKPAYISIVLFSLLLVSQNLYSQTQNTSDSTRKVIDRLMDNDVTKRMMKNFTKKKADSVFNIKSETPFLPYANKIVRKIIVEQIGFEKNIIDTARTVKSFFARTGNKLHVNSREWVIRNNLFIREGKPLNPYRVADNERYLRDIDFILDSRIFVRPIYGTDSVDLLVVTRDVFSLEVNLTPYSPHRYRASVQDANLGGMGQRAKFTTYYNMANKPTTGYELVYKKSNMFGSFIDGTVAYTTINTGTSLGLENENAYYLRLSRPLFMPYTRWAGGMELSRNWSTNVSHEPDSIFANYRYNISDLWAGYSFGHKKKMKDILESRSRKFIAIRGLDDHFVKFPTVPLNSVERLVYNNRTAVLAQLTFFRQDFYKTRYILGFGRTEDVPYGYRVSFTSGWEKESGRQRPYAGVDLYRNVVEKNGTIMTYNARMATYWKNKTAEDTYLAFSFTRFSRLFIISPNYKFRHQLGVGYARQYNQVQKRRIDINDVNGITLFRPDSLFGSKRMTISSQSILYTPWNVEGFHIAPVIRIDLAFLAQNSQNVLTGKYFSGYSGGFRIRNENLIFNTVEIRTYYYPTTVEGISHLRFDIRANISIKYPTILVSAPATVYDN